MHATVDTLTMDDTLIAAWDVLDLDTAPLNDPLLAFDDAASLLGYDEYEPNGWALHDARIIAVKRGGLLPRYEIGCLVVYSETTIGAYDGRYLPIADFTDEAVATAFCEDLQTQFALAQVTTATMAAYVEAAASLYGTQAEWRPASLQEYMEFEAASRP